MRCPVSKQRPLVVFVSRQMTGVERGQMETDMCHVPGCRAASPLYKSNIGTNVVWRIPDKCNEAASALCCEVATEFLIELY